ncbi:MULTISPECIES: 2Fe-2S iron-sulfur cluster-binding protein [Sphingomonas]|jgi:ferredoxin|uniref:Ferredoxin n=1 Tax=Sphingomonas aerolata TaxID=185951 RepID=A0A2T4YRF5_9SPHN|nr:MULTISPECIES: 2Fe-2S iron-sulfur cluster-binding protein [Sphingomonas]RZM09032.1 MAG: 2Fe-2S iron-sulfur cluster binding domain-containing protein [Sphingomonas sp.]MBD8468774.1 2Fe-2S iron-sulfur cluster binding domain-containing protein [Sphingomonas sp. CFBP 8765]MBD8699505.1 2Fe-2S iron-sulfur cluster binding domain-containing protein [Sphingomonas sp. CFBP 13714]MDY1008364.1 2Fe-2S iron-sulfur cluster-binding protein [Sphingomonas sp. CFBP9019]PTM46095.1 ferredoxin [Sphingomonas aerol
MIVHFIARDGSMRSVAATPGDRLLDAAQADGQPLEGTCEGQLACATCHVIVDAADVARLPPASADEEDMLDLAPGATRTSRLACQIRLTEALDGLTVRIPG